MQTGTTPNLELLVALGSSLGVVLLPALKSVGGRIYLYQKHSKNIQKQI
jgi:hypothetical protein